MTKVDEDLANVSAVIGLVVKITKRKKQNLMFKSNKTIGNFRSVNFPKVNKADMPLSMLICKFCAESDDTQNVI